MRRTRANRTISLIACGLASYAAAACSASGGEEDGTGVVVEGNDPGAPPILGQGGAGGTDQMVPGGGDDSGFDFGESVGCGTGCAFPVDPIYDAAVGPEIAPEQTAAFADPDAFSPSGLCVFEPHLGEVGTPGALFPRNWLRPRFRWTGTGSETLWEIQLSHPDEPETLRAYTRDTQWILPEEVWQRMGRLATPVTVTVRGLDGAGNVSGQRGTFSIAPVDAGGSLVFWATTSAIVTPTSSKLQGFAVGDEGVVQTLTATDVETTDIIGENGAVPRGYYPYEGGQRTGFEPGQVECVGCHVSTPDGAAVVFTDNWPWNKVVASIEPESRGAVPAYVSDSAVAVMKQPWLGMQAMSPAHFSAGDRVVVTSYGVRLNGSRGNPGDAQVPFDAYDPQFASGQGPTLHRLAWFDLEAQSPVPIPDELPPFGSVEEGEYYGDPDFQARRQAMSAAYQQVFGLINTAGETRSAVTPTWSHGYVDENGGSPAVDEIAYVSTDVSSSDGHPDWTANVANIHVVPYENRQGGTVRALEGASDPNFLEYYPEYSSDDAFVAFTRAPTPSTANRCIPTLNAQYQVQACPPQDLGENPDGPYYNRNGEIYVVPRAGGTPTRLAANDPVACSGETSRGIINSWPKWSPRVISEGGKKYYFLIFSSARAFDGAFELPPAPTTPAISLKSSQLYMAALTVDEASGAIETYPAVYLWNQNISVDAVGNATLIPTSNLTPAWDDFSIPEVPPSIAIPR